MLCNESFASTDEREGSEIARQVIRALTEAGIRIFLCAEHRPDGQRTFRVPPGEPLPTSYGEDLCQQVFGPADAAARAGETLTVSSVTPASHAMYPRRLRG